MCEGDFTPIPAEGNEHHDVMFAEDVAARTCFAQLIVPDGQITDPPVQPFIRKYSGSLFTQITSTSLPIPRSHEGRFAIVTDVGAGCGGRGMSKDE
jgi:hypothetical protein